MRKVMRSLAAVAMALACSVFQIPTASAALSLQGTTTSNMRPTTVIKANSQAAATGVLKFLFSAPSAGSYSLTFCITSDPANLCGSGSYVVTVPGGQQRLAVVNAAAFADGALTVYANNSAAYPYSVTVE
jgi:uncharacterized membrane protein YedE/YeeE